MELEKRKLQILMAKKQMNAKELAEKSGLSHNTISSFLVGRRKPSIKGMLANGLSVDVEEIIEDEKEKE